MHEASITQSIIDSVLATLEGEDVSGTVTAVNVTAGVCQGLIPESMQMFFDMQKPGTPLEHAELIVAVQGMVARCSRCEKEHVLDVPNMFCPTCGEPMTLVRGKEILISSIEVDDEFEKDID